MQRGMKYCVTLLLNGRIDTNSGYPWNGDEIGTKSEALSGTEGDPAQRHPGNDVVGPGGRARDRNQGQRLAGWRHALGSARASGTRCTRARAWHSSTSASAAEGEPARGLVGEAIEAGHGGAVASALEDVASIGAREGLGGVLLAE